MPTLITLVYYPIVHYLQLIRYVKCRLLFAALADQVGSIIRTIIEFFNLIIALEFNGLNN